MYGIRSFSHYITTAPFFPICIIAACTQLLHFLNKKLKETKHTKEWHVRWMKGMREPRDGQNPAATFLL